MVVTLYNISKYMKKLDFLKLFIEKGNKNKIYPDLIAIQLDINIMIEIWYCFAKKN
jgi:hypothetical protein